MVALAGPCAIETREPRQARKGATVVIFLCAAARLVSAATLFFSPRDDLDTCVS